MMALIDEITLCAPELVDTYQLKRLGLFGSVARRQESIDSDIDMYVEFSEPFPETMPERYFGLINQISSQFNRPVQVLTPSMISNPVFQSSMERDLIFLYG